MDITTEVRPGANRYVSGENILQDLPSYLVGFKKISVITGEKSSEAFKNIIVKSFTILPIDMMAALVMKMRLK